MSCKCAPALLQARNELNLLFPNRDKASDGCCGNAEHLARKSDHNPRQSGPGKGYAAAYDFDEDIANLGNDQELLPLIGHLIADPRTKYVIYEKHIYYPDGQVKPYNGINAHKSHLHLSIHDSAIFQDWSWELDKVNFGGGQSPAQPMEVESMVVRNPVNSYNYLLNGDNMVLVRKMPLPPVPLYEPDVETFEAMTRAWPVVD